VKIKRYIQLTIFLFFSLRILLGCYSPIDSLEDYYKYINNENNGLSRAKTIGPLLFETKILPSNLLVMRDYQNGKGNSIDSLKKEYAPSLNFILKVSPSEEAEVKFDVMTETVSSLEEFKEQAFSINFKLKEYIYLSIGKKKIKPVLVETENVYGLTKHRMVNIVFAKEDLSEYFLKDKEVDFVFNDQIYNTGIHHFRFEVNDIINVPQVVIN